MQFSFHFRERNHFHKDLYIWRQKKQYNVWSIFLLTLLLVWPFNPNLWIQQAISKWVDAAEADFDSMFQVMFDVLGITEAIHKDAEALSDSDSDTLTPLNDVTLDDLLLDDLDGSDTDTGDPSWEWV